MGRANNKKLVLIKLGGSVITDKNTPYRVRGDIIKRLAIELKEVEKDFQIVISHGAGSFAHTSASKYGGKKGYVNKLGIAKVAKDVIDMNKLVVDALIDQGIPAVSIRPGAIIIAQNGKIRKAFFDSIAEMLKQNLVPVVFGDVIWDKKWKSTIFSGELVLNHIADYLIGKKYKIERIIQIGETNGVYDARMKTVDMIDKKNWHKIKKFIKKGNRIDVTGGMIHKIETSLILAEKGIKTIIINGNTPRELVNAFYDKKVKGTFIV